MEKVIYEIGGAKQLWGGTRRGEHNDQKEKRQVVEKTELANM